MATTHQALQPGRVYGTRDLAHWKSNPMSEEDIAFPTRPARVIATRIGEIEA